MSRKRKNHTAEDSKSMQKGMHPRHTSFHRTQPKPWPMPICRAPLLLPGLGGWTTPDVALPNTNSTVTSPGQNSNCASMAGSLQETMVASTTAVDFFLPLTTVVTAVVEPAT